MNNNLEIARAFNSMTEGNKLKVLKHYIPRLVASVQVRANPDLLHTPAKFLRDWCKHSGGSRSGTSWDDRVSRWESDGAMWLTLDADTGYSFTVARDQRQSTRFAIPIFKSWITVAMATVQTNQTEKEEIPTISHSGFTTSAPEQTTKKEETSTMNNIKNTTATLSTQHKEAAKLSAKLAVGRTANEFVMDKLAKMFPWYKRRAIKKNAMLKVLTAEVINAIAQHTGNSKASLLGDAMLQEAFIEGTVYSSVLTDIIKSLEDTIDLSALESLAK